jgi:hypothetical protein
MHKQGPLDLWSLARARTGSNQLVSATNHFKCEVPDGKQRSADALDAE